MHEEVKAVTKRLKFWMQLVGSSSKFVNTIKVNRAMMQLGGKLATTDMNGPRWREDKKTSAHYPELFDLYIWEERPSVNWPVVLSALSVALTGREYLKFEVMQRFGWASSTCFAVLVTHEAIDLRNLTERVWEEIDFIHSLNGDAQCSAQPVEPEVIDVIPTLCIQSE